MSKINESPNNKDEKSSKLIIISKNRVESAKDRVNLVTLKEGDLELTVKLENDSLDKNGIKEAVKSIKNQILINSKSYATLNEKSYNLKSYLKKSNILKTPIIEKQKSQILQKSENLFLGTTRNLNSMKTTTENNRLEIEEDVNKLETIIPIETNTEENLKVNSYLDKNNYKKDINIVNNKIKINNYNNFNVIEIISKDEEKNDNINKNENNVLDTALISRNYYNNAKSYKRKKNDKIFDKYKSEEIKQITNSVSSRSKVVEKIKNNNYFEKNNQRSDKAAKSISDQEQDNKNKFESKIILDSVGKEENIKDNKKFQRLMTEYDDNNKGDKKNLITESHSSETIKVDEEEEDDKDNELITNEINKNNQIHNEIRDLIEKGKISKTKLEFSHNIAIGKDITLKQIHNKNIIHNSSNSVFQLCSICEHAFPLARIFMAECKIHYLCRKCAKNYYEDIIENGVKQMLCPFTKCKEPVDLEDLKNLISKEHYNLLIKNKEGYKNKIYTAKLKSNIDNENLQLYTRKNVIDINSNKNFFNYNNAKGVYCPDCHMDTLFSKTNTHFYKCLNCESKKCKYCLKDYKIRHMDVSCANHCKVHYRADDDEDKKDSNIILKFLLQIFFVCASYYLCFAGIFLLMRNFFFLSFGINLKRGNIFMVILIHLLVILCLLLISPFIIFFHPFFPSILALSDY